MILFHVPCVDMDKLKAIGLAIWADDEETARSAVVAMLGESYEVGEPRIAPAMQICA